MDLHEDVEKAALDSGVDGVVDQVHHRVGGRAVVGEERGGDCWVDSLADGHTLGHYSSKSIPDSRFEFSIAAFDRPRGLKGTSSFQPESSPIVPAEISRLREEIKGLVEQLRLTHALPPSGSQDSSHDPEVDAFAGVEEFPHFSPLFLAGYGVLSVEQSGHFGHELSLCSEEPRAIDVLWVVVQYFDRNLQPLTEFGLIDRIHINPDALDLQLAVPAADVVPR